MSRLDVLSARWADPVRRALGLAALLLAATGPVQAQASAPQQAFDALSHWVGVVEQPLPAPPATVKGVTPQAPATDRAKGGTPLPRFEPMPVILGAPELPLVGAASPQALQAWADSANYQGVQVQVLRIDPQTRRTRAAPVSGPLPRNQPFKLRLIATFDGVATVDQLLGTDWSLTRFGQAYPSGGQAVEVKARQPVELPLGDDAYFVLRGRSANERLLLSLRHAKASGPARSDQPAYRRDLPAGSLYVQLVPKGQHPAIEQVLSIAR